MTGAIIVALVVTVALVFDFTNGFHDTANAMATAIATGALRPKIAVAVAALLNFVGAFISIKVAATIANSLVDSGAVTLTVIFSGWSARSPGIWRLVVRDTVVVFARSDRESSVPRSPPSAPPPSSSAAWRPAWSSRP